MSIPKPPHAEGQEFTNDVTGVTYKFDGVKWIASGGGEEIDLSGYVRKEGGDSMQGPLVMRPQDGSAGRDTNRVQTLGVFSNSDSSALRLGTTRDRVYVGHNDVSINGPVKLQSLESKNPTDPIYIKDDVHFNKNADLDGGINIVITNPNAIDKTHDEYDVYSCYPLRIKPPSGSSRFAVRLDDGAGPYSLDESGGPFQGSHPNYLATIGLLQDRAVKAHPKEVVSMGGLSLAIVDTLRDTDDCLYTEAKIKDDYSKIVLNHDPLDSGQRVDWLDRFPGDSTMFIQQGDKTFTLETTAVTAAGTNSRAKHFNIRSHDIPHSGLSAARIEVGKTVHEASEPYLVSQEEFQALKQEVSSPAGFSVPVTFKCKGYLGCSTSSPPPAGQFCIMYNSGNSTSANAWFGNCNHSIKVHYENLMSPEGLEISEGEEWNVSGYVTVIGNDHKPYLKAPINKVRRNSGMAYVTIYFSSPVTTWGVGGVDDASSYMVLVEGYGASSSTFAEDSEVEE